ncbi:MAG: pilus assembly protein TadG-related protein, partial [Cohaesibacter sp.]|nr:pilus assembly protein TadG-related protein [Cohaesibacter sp.]
MHSQSAHKLKKCLKHKSSQLAQHIRASVSHFHRNEEGTVAIIFALSIMPLIMLGGAAIDYARASNQQQQVQDAVDAAVLAAVNRIPLQNDNEIKKLIR